MKKAITTLYKVLNIFVAVALIIGLAFAILLPALFVNHKSIRDFLVWYLAVTGIFYFVLAFSFVFALVRLYRKIALV